MKILVIFREREAKTQVFGVKSQGVTGRQEKLAVINTLSLDVGKPSVTAGVKGRKVGWRVALRSSITNSISVHLPGAQSKASFLVSWTAPRGIPQEKTPQCLL